jgi:hypothetical protein
MLLSTGLPSLAQGVDPQGPTDLQEVEVFADAFFVALAATGVLVPFLGRAWPGMRPDGERWGARGTEGKVKSG